MDIVNIQNSEPFHFNVPSKHWKFVEFAFVGAPVVAVFPFVDEAFDIGKRDTIFPTGVAQFVREAGIGEFAMKEGESIIGHGNLKAGFRGHDARRKSEREDIGGWFELICISALVGRWSNGLMTRLRVGLVLHARAIRPRSSHGGSSHSIRPFGPRWSEYTGSRSKLQPHFHHSTTQMRPNYNNAKKVRKEK